MGDRGSLINQLGMTLKLWNGQSVNTCEPCHHAYSSHISLGKLDSHRQRGSLLPSIRDELPRHWKSG